MTARGKEGDGSSPTLDERDAPLDVTEPTGSGDGEFQGGTTLGRYVILKSIGRGGMGVVYLAFDNELERRVALKVLRPAAREGVSLAEARARLLREAQALAKVSHPNVVAVFDVGSLGDEVFLAMEYVDGTTLRGWRTAATRSVREIVDACIQAGRGLEAAHAEGILHRDFKPDNLLVDARGRVKVVDFGLARLEAEPIDPTERDGGAEPETASLDEPLTHAGALLGTPAYMAPEQIVGEKVDPRTDQFSFCVTLYEALYGTKPFDAVYTSVPDIVTAVYEGKLKPVPAKPRVPRGVRRAIQRGLSGEPADRFATMGDLLAELERAMASPKRWLAGSAAGLAIAIGVAVSARSSSATPCRGADEAIAPAWSKARAAAVAKAFKASGNARADDAFARTSALLDKYAASWIAMNTSACEATRVHGVQSAEGLDLRMGCLNQRAKELKATVDLFASADAKLVDDAVEAAARLTPVDTCVDIAALRAPFAPPKHDAQRRAVEDLRGRLAEVDALVLAGRMVDAYPIAVSLVDDAARTEYDPARAETLWRKGQIESSLAKPEAPQTLFDAASEAEAVRHDEVAARSWTMLVFEAGFVQAKYDEAGRYARLADSAIRRFGNSELLRADLLDVQSNVASGRGDPAEAVALARRAIAIHEKTLGHSHPLTLQTRSNLADGLWEEGEADEAVTAYEELYRDRVALLGEAHPATVRTMLDIAEAKRELGDYAAALSLVDRIRALEQPDEPPIHVAAMQLQRAYTLMGLGRVDEGIAVFQEAITTVSALRGGASSFVGSHLSTCARVLAQQRENAQAESYAKRALAILNKLDDRDEDRGESLGVIALCKARRGDAAGALADADAALAAKEKFLGDRADIIPLLARGQALAALHREKEGLADLEHAMAIGETKAGDPGIRADVKSALARVRAMTSGVSAP